MSLSTLSTKERSRSMAPRHLTLGLVVLLLVTGGCSSSGSEPFPYANCGNGTIERGESCDDGPPATNNCDTCACTSICQQAYCGDGFVYLGVEQCDLNNLNQQTCSTLGFAGGTLSCFACRFNTARCGPAFTPTPLVPTPTPTPSPRPTSTPGGTCIPEGRIPVTVTFTAGAPIQSISISLAYPGGEVALPSTNVQSRITNRPAGTQLTASVSDSTLRASVSRAFGTFPPGRLFVVDFDRCAGTDPPLPTEFTCRVTQCSGESCACSVALP